MNSPLDSILPEITSLVRSLKPSPSWWIVRDGDPVDDDTFPTEAEAEERLEDHRGFCEAAPVHVQLTIGATILPDGSVSWGYQTGDNSFTGGAYGHATWGVAWISHESDPEEIAGEILDEIADQISY